MGKVRRFIRSEEVSADKAYCYDIHGVGASIMSCLYFYYNIKLQLYYFPKIFEGWNVQVYYREETHSVPVEMTEGKCDVLATFGTYFCLKGPSSR